MSSTISFSFQLYKAVKGYGTRRAEELISIVSYYFLPIMFWATLYFVLGGSLFTRWSPITDLSIIFLFLIVFSVIITSIFTLSKHLKLFKAFVHRINEVSSGEQRDIALGYLNYPKLFRLSALSSSKSKMHIVVSSIALVISIFASFGLVALLASHRELQMQIFSLLTPIAPIISNLVQVQLIIIVSWLFVLLFSYLYFVRAHPIVQTIWIAKKLGVTVSLWSYLIMIVDCISIISRISSGLYSLIWLIYRPHFRWAFIKYLQFPISSNITKLVERAYENVQGESCEVSRFEIKFDSEDDSTRLFQVIKRSFSEFLSIFPIVEGKSRFVNTLINSRRMTLYLGFVKKKLVFFGSVYFLLNPPVRTAIFSFDNPFTSKEFQEIIDLQMIKNRENL